MNQIKKAAEALSERYRKGDRPYLRSPEDRYAYVATRLPATQAVLRRVVQEINDFSLTSYLDIGAGPGGSWEVIKQAIPSIEKATLVELDHVFLKIGQNQLKEEPVTWIHRHAESLNDVKQHDMVLFSYSWGEMHDLHILAKAWELCNSFLVVIEPGTPRGFASIIKVREFLIQKGAKIAAPCPHLHLCPLYQQGYQEDQRSDQESEWCHFGTRLERSREHQWMKGGSRGFEDEKFSYIIFSKNNVKTFFGRMVKDSLRRKGHTVLTLCTEEGIVTPTISKKSSLYKGINKLSWGDKIIDSI